MAIKNTLRKITGISLTALALAGCSKTEKGVIQEESFNPHAPVLNRIGYINNHEVYTVSIKTLDGRSIWISYLDDKARKANLRYNSGDTVRIRRFNQERGSGLYDRPYGIVGMGRPQP